MIVTCLVAHLFCEDEGKRQKIADLVSYMENYQDGLYGSRSLGYGVKTRRVLVCGCDVIKKNIDLVIGRRFKKQDMNWTGERANKLQKLARRLY